MVLAGPDRDASAAAGHGGVPGQEGGGPGGLHRHAADQVSAAVRYYLAVPLSWSG